MYGCARAYVVLYISWVFDSPISFRYPASANNKILKAVVPAVRRTGHCLRKEDTHMTEKHLADCPRCGAELIIERA